MKTRVFIRLHLPPPAYFSDGEEEIRQGWVRYDPDNYRPAVRKTRTFFRDRVPNSYLSRIVRGEIKPKFADRKKTKKIIRNRVMELVRKLRKDTGTVYTSRVYKNSLDAAENVNTPQLQESILAAARRTPPVTAIVHLPAPPTLPVAKINPRGGLVLPLLGVAAAGATTAYLIGRNNRET